MSIWGTTIWRKTKAKNNQWENTFFQYFSIHSSQPSMKRHVCISYGEWHLNAGLLWSVKSNFHSEQISMLHFGWQWNTTRATGLLSAPNSAFLRSNKSLGGGFLLWTSRDVTLLHLCTKSWCKSVSVLLPGSDLWAIRVAELCLPSVPPPCCRLVCN